MRVSPTLLVMTLVLVAVPALGQDPDYVLKVHDGNLTLDHPDAVSIILDYESGDGLIGWSYGLCHSEPAVADIDGVVPGVLVAALNGGEGPDFYAAEVHSGQGFTVSATTTETLGNSLGFLVLNRATYVGLEIGEATLEFCGALGSPNVPISLHTAAGETIDDPTLDDGTLTVVEPLIEYLVDSTTGTYNPLTGRGDDVIVTLSVATANGEDENTYGLTVVLLYDGPVTLTEVTDVLVTNWDDPPDFFSPLINPLGEPGFIVPICQCILDTGHYEFEPEPTPIIELRFEVDDPSLIGNPTGALVEVYYGNGIGDPPSYNCYVEYTSSGCYPPLFTDGFIELIPATAFLRGDCNDDARVDIADGIHVIQAFLLGEPLLGSCVEACDTNGDGLGPDVSDVVYLFNYRFFDGPPPPAPFPECGSVPDGVDCDGSVSCP